MTVPTERLSHQNPAAANQRPADDLAPATAPDGPGPMRYLLGYRGKFLFLEAKSIHDVIHALETQAAFLRLLRARGVVLDEDCSPEDDYLDFVTDDPAVAKEFGFEEEEEWHDEDEEWHDGDEGAKGAEGFFLC